MNAPDPKAIAWPGPAGMIVPQLTLSDTRPRISSRQRTRLLAVFLVVLVGACGGQPRIPTQAGVVRAVEPGPGQADRVVLDSGEVLIEGTRNQLYGGGSPQVGDLLIAGTDGTETWYLVVRPGAPSAAGRPCYPLAVIGVDRGDSIDTSVGVRLPKTADFDRGPDTDGKYNEQPHSFCLDERGAIYRWV